MSIVQSAQSGVGSIRKGREYLDSLANKYILGPQNMRGIGGFVFDYEDRTSVQAQSEITDHFVEDNTAVHDHIATRPLRITLGGFVGELVLAEPQGVLGALAATQNRLGLVDAYLQDYTPGMVQKLRAATTAAANAVNAFDQGLARVENIVSFFGKAAPAKTKQQQAFHFLNTLRETKQVFWLETPYQSFDSMAIELLTAEQDGASKGISEFTVTLKQIRIVDVETTKFDNKLMGRAAYQKQAAVDKGKTKGTEKPVSWLKSLVNGATQ